jgi:hypothetical protein
MLKEFKQQLPLPNETLDQIISIHKSRILSWEQYSYSSMASFPTMTAGSYSCYANNVKYGTLAGLSDSATHQFNHERTLEEFGGLRQAFLAYRHAESGRFMSS